MMPDRHLRSVPGKLFHSDLRGLRQLCPTFTGVSTLKTFKLRAENWLTKLSSLNRGKFSDQLIKMNLIIPHF